jgi:hypothetical protein
MDQFNALIGEWNASGRIEIEGESVAISGHTIIERLGKLVVVRATVTPAEFPNSVSVIGGGEEGEPAPMHYFDERGVHRLYLSTVADGKWWVWRGDETWRESPGFNQRYAGEICPDGNTISGAWERGHGEAGDQWETDFQLDYTRA